MPWGQCSTWVGGAVGWGNYVSEFGSVLSVLSACFCLLYCTLSVLPRLRLPCWLAALLLRLLVHVLLLLLLLLLSVRFRSLCCTVPCFCVSVWLFRSISGTCLGIFVQHRASSTALHAEFAFLYLVGPICFEHCSLYFYFVLVFYVELF